jgi:hypothetical protein
MPLESKFQRELREDLEYLLPGSMIFKMDPVLHGQGIPDLLILYKTRWAALECKRAPGARKQPNQDWYVEVMNNMSFAAFIDPTNREEIINELCEALGARRSSRYVRS